MRASTGIVFVELLVAMVGLRSIAEARTKARAGFLRVGSRAKVSERHVVHHCALTTSEAKAPTASQVTVSTSSDQIGSPCWNGFAGIQTDNVCCELQCGQCGGLGCEDAPGGANSCCSAQILNAGSSCDDVDSAPCHIPEDEPTPSPPSFTCSNGFIGIQTDNACCDVNCGVCGGMGCEDTPGGATSCCTDRLLNGGRPCDEVGAAPCFIPDAKPTPSPMESFCSNGFIRIQTDNACSDVHCGVCGGIGCEDTPGGATSCCTGRLLNGGSPCDEVGAAPCFIPETEPTPSPMESFCSNGFIGIQTDNACCDMQLSAREGQGVWIPQRGGRM